MFNPMPWRQLLSSAELEQLERSPLCLKLAQYLDVLSDSSDYVLYYLGEEMLLSAGPAEPFRHPYAGDLFNA